MDIISDNHEEETIMRETIRIPRSNTTRSNTGTGRYGCYGGTTDQTKEETASFVHISKSLQKTQSSIESKTKEKIHEKNRNLFVGRIETTSTTCTYPYSFTHTHTHSCHLTHLSITNRYESYHHVKPQYPLQD